MPKLLKRTGLILFILFFYPALILAEDITITTYYPSPYGSYKNLNIYNQDESITQTDFTQSLTKAGLIITTDYTADAYTPGIFWTMTNSTPTKPKAGIYLKETGTGTNMYFGTSNAYATGITNDAMVINPSGYVGIGTTAPGERLEVNGAIKFTADSSVISKAPQVIYTSDSRAGCPPAAAAGTDLYTQTFTPARTAAAVIVVDTITNFAGRTDTYLVVDGVSMRSTLTNTTSDAWEPVHIIWGGTLTAASHTVSVRSSTANSVGCGAIWGGITTMIYE